MEINLVDSLKSDNSNEVNLTWHSLTTTVMEVLTDSFATENAISKTEDYTSGVTQNVSFIASIFGAPVCLKWEPVNHVYFQLANTFFFLSYLAPNGVYGILYLRCTLLVGCAFFALWGWAVLCSFDAFLWNATFVAINFLQVCILLYHLRPIKFTKEVEEVSILFVSFFLTCACLILDQTKPCIFIYSDFVMRHTFGWVLNVSNLILTWKYLCKNITTMKQTWNTVTCLIAI